MMQMKAILGLLCLGLAVADVRDIINKDQGAPVLAAQSFSNNNNNGFKSGGTFVANKAFNAGNSQSDNNRKRYWWMETGSSPFRSQNTFDSDGASTEQYKKQQQNSNQNYGFNYNPSVFKCFSAWCRDEVPLNSKHNTLQQHNTVKRNHYSQNPFLVNLISQPSNNIHTQTSISGSPSEINSLLVSQSSQSSPFGSTFTSNSLSSGTFSSGQIPCTAPGKVCAPKQYCNNGYIKESQLGLFLSQSTVCNSATESCCTIDSTNDQSQEQSTSCNQPNSACVSPNACYNGYIEKFAENSARSRQSSDRCYAPEVCCQFRNYRSANYEFGGSQDDDNTVAAAQSSSTVLTNEGYVVRVPSNQYLPVPKPDSQNDVPVVVTTPRPQPTTTRYVPPQTTTTRYVPPQTTTTRYVPPQTTTTRYVPPQTTTTRYVPPSTTFKGDEYIPPVDNEVPQPSNDDETVIRPTTSTLRPTQPRPTPGPTRPGPGPTRPGPGPTRPGPGPTQPRPTQPRPTPPRPTPGVQVQDENLFIPVGCPAAMNCTPIEFCTSTAVISKTPVQLTPEQELFRVPMTDCREPNTGARGKCCRDPDYVDPWPASVLGQYNAEILGFDDGSYKPERRRRNQGTFQRSVPSIQVNRGISSAEQREPLSSASQAVSVRQPLNQQRFENNRKNVPQQNQQESCGVRNLNTQPRGPQPYGTGFGEFSWQTMVLLESNKSLLCGGTILNKNLVLTTGNCVYGLRHNDVLIKGGEWRLGFDDPKQFQIVRVQKILFHPQFRPSTTEHDLALLHLENNLKYDTHIGPICLDEYESQPSLSDRCLTTGWGKQVLKIHLADALMQQVSISTLSQAECQAQLANSRVAYSNSIICGVPSLDSCQVDVGSALACPDQNGRYILKGVYSTETGCNSNPNQIVAFSKADLQWIKELKYKYRPTY
jgi:hypothetical protein